MSQTSQILGSQADFLLGHRCKTIAATDLHLPGPDFVDRIWSASNRSIPVLRSMQTLYGTGRLAGSGYLSILPVDQGIEHSAGASFASNPIYFDSE
ncbi:MAG: fructose-bisphosphate aldolase, partial [Cytophagia bacterium]|nr:fructose-bisphosphate aldolase [Cytophagia bacterium]